MSPQEKMIQEIKSVYGLDVPSVFSAMLKVPRDEFTPKEYQYLAYEDQAIPIGYGQTMSQPYTVCFMTNLLDLKGDEKVLEIGTGSGYQAAVLSYLSRKVYSVEIIEELTMSARKRLKRLKLKNVEIKAGTGELGWKEHAPYDAILVTAAIENDVPEELFDQLGNLGVLVAPVGRKDEQVMTKYERQGKKIKKEEHGIFVFVPFIEET